MVVLRARRRPFRGDGGERSAQPGDNGPWWLHNALTGPQWLMGNGAKWLLSDSAPSHLWLCAGLRSVKTNRRVAVHPSGHRLEPVRNAAVKRSAVDGLARGVSRNRLGTEYDINKYVLISVSYHTRVIMFHTSERERHIIPTTYHTILGFYSPIFIIFQFDYFYEVDKLVLKVIFSEWLILYRIVILIILYYIHLF